MTPQIPVTPDQPARQALRLSLMVLAVTGLTACATVEGAGRDISAAGDAVADTAREVRRAF